MLSIRRSPAGKAAWLTLPAIAGVWFLASALPTIAAEEEEQQRRIGELIEMLGDPAYSVRTQAVEQLRAIGLPARVQLLSACESRDAEVRRHARLLLLQVLERDFENRVAAFAADTDGSGEHDLPGWEVYRGMVGDAGPARDLFVRMLREEPLLLETLEIGPDPLKQALARRCEEMFQELRRPVVGADGRRVAVQFSLGTVAAVYFAASHPEVEVDNNLAMQLNHVMQRSPFRNEVARGEFAEPLKRLLGFWIADNADSQLAFQHLQLALMYDIQEGIEPAKHLIRTNPAGGSILPTAIMAVAKLGSEEDAEILHSLLDREQVLRNVRAGNRAYTSQVRDVALLALLHLEGEDPEEYGFENLTANPQTIYQVSTIGFPSEEDRIAALEKWAALRE